LFGKEGLLLSNGTNYQTVEYEKITIAHILISFT